MALLDDASRRSLLLMARAAIARAIGAVERDTRRDPIPNPQSPIPGDLRQARLSRSASTASCAAASGIPEPDLPLVEVVERCAVSAAISDPRFPPLRPSNGPRSISRSRCSGRSSGRRHTRKSWSGRHGLIVEFGRRRGLLLPQVAVEWKWDASEFAAQTCIKAGLPSDAWQKGAKLFKFEAEVFGEGYE